MTLSYVLIYLLAYYLSSSLDYTSINEGVFYLWFTIITPVPGTGHKLKAHYLNERINE